MAILSDTGFLFALLDHDDKNHNSAKELLARTREQFLVPVVVLPEVCYLTHKHLGPSEELRFLRSLTEGELPLEWTDPLDLRRAVEILQARPEFGMVDATVMATAERLKIRQVATFDRRHFGSFRPAHCPFFELLP